MLDELPMSKDEAIKAMRDGMKVTHRHFSSEEWMKETGRLYEFEDGCLCEFEEFWRYREDDSWLEGWKIFQ